MKISLETVEDSVEIESEEQRARDAYKLNPNDPNAAPKIVHPDGVTTRIRALGADKRNAIADAIESGDCGGGANDWILRYSTESRAKYPNQWQAKVNAIVAELRK